MKNKIRCSDCPMMKIPYRARENWLSRMRLGGSRGYCYCKHPDVVEVFDTLVGLWDKATGFICCTVGSSDTPALKTAPRWCPRKILTTPSELDLHGAYRVIEKRSPRGLFYHREGDVYVGIDNTTGDAWTEDFPTKAECIKWLTGGKKHEED